MTGPSSAAPRVVDGAGLRELLGLLVADGRRVLGPTVRGGAIVVDEIDDIEALPQGWTDRHEPGRYRLQRRADRALFGYVVGADSFKRAFFSPRAVLLRAKRTDGSFVVLDPSAVTPPRVALFGARACDLEALAVLDRVLADPKLPDGDYLARRRDAFVVAVQCGQAAATCFCASMGTGPRATSGFDLALTELLEGEHRFLVEEGSPAGAAMLARLASGPATAEDQAAADRALQHAAAGMVRSLDTTALRELLFASVEHPRWEQTAARCLSCTSCTMVCPTCFCSTVEDVTDLAGEVAERARRWDSCFTVGHSIVHGGPVHASVASRYRQWLTHKLAAWLDQFGTSGCVGCGRCITWCPAGIDLTEEVAALRAARPTSPPRRSTIPTPMVRER